MRDFIHGENINCEISSIAENEIYSTNWCHQVILQLFQWSQLLCWHGLWHVSIDDDACSVNMQSEIFANK